MEKFNRTIRGYDPEEVNAFLDKVITQVEAMVNEIKQKDQEILRLQSLNEENVKLREKILQYEKKSSILC